MTTTKKRLRDRDEPEEKKEADTDVGEGSQEVSRSIGEQRASRLRQRRRGRQVGSTVPDGGGRRRRREKEDDDDDDVLEADEKCNGHDDDGEAPGYTTAYAAIRHKYPRHLEMIETCSRKGDGMAQYRKNYQNLHVKLRNTKRARGVKLIQKRWRSRMNDYKGAPNHCASSEHPTTTLTDGNNGTRRPKPMKPALAYRKYTDYSAARHYQNIHFLNEQTILAIDSYGDLDVVGLPLSIRDDGDNEAGVGTHLARMPISPTLNSGGHGPRCPLPKCHLEPFGYQRGQKFVVGLPSGRAQLFSSERMDASACPDRSGGARCTARHYSDDARADDADAVWACLPANARTVGPRRRYVRNDECSLAYMLSSAAFKNNEFVIESFNDHATFEEIPNWNYDDVLSPFSLTRSHASSKDSNSLWAFREGGIGGASGTALMGGFIDPDSDCFSLRILDERVGGGGGGVIESANSDTASPMVFVDATSHSSGKTSASDWAVDEVRGICFSGEYGLVTNHVVKNPFGTTRDSIIKWWDHRMLRSQAVGVASLVFPRDGGVCGVLPALKYSLCTDRELGSMKFRLQGSNDSSDRFAVSILCCGRLDEILVVDPSCTQDAQHKRICGGSHSDIACFSSNLDFLARHNEKQDEVDATDSISIFDISRHNADDNYDTYGFRGHFEEKSVKVGHLGSGEGENVCEGFLGRVDPTLTDAYGITSQLSCMAMDKFGSRIACGTYDGDVFILQQ